MNRDGTAKLDFIQNIEYKFIELLSADFMASSEEIVRQSITFRYNSVKSKVALMEARLKDVNNLVKSITLFIVVNTKDYTITISIKEIQVSDEKEIFISIISKCV